MRIEILGAGCQRCIDTERIAREAVKLAGITADIVHETDARAIAERRVVHTLGGPQPRKKRVVSLGWPLEVRCRCPRRPCA